MADMQHFLKHGCRWCSGLILLAGLVLLPAVGFCARTVSLPLTVRYDLLEAMSRRSMFAAPGQAFVLADPADPCRSIRLSEPRFSAVADRLRFEVRIDASIGTRIGQSCITPVQWNGYLALIQTPRMDPQTWQLAFKTEDVMLYDGSHRPLGAGSVVGELVKAQVVGALDRMTIDLAPPVDEFKAFLLPLFPQTVRQDTLRMLDSMRAGPVRVTPAGLEMDILADVTEVYEAEKDVVQEPVSGEALRKLVETWQTWDAFLVSLLNSLPAAQLTNDDRRVLLDTLLDIRHGFLRELTEGTLEKGFVRRQFVETWNRIAPVFMAHLTDSAPGSGAGYLAFFTASDALTVLDRIGPTMGLEISRNGLIRMAKYMHLGNAETLAYAPAVDMQLRRVLGFGPLPETAAPDGNAGPEEGRTGQGTDSSRVTPGRQPSFFSFFSPSVASAAEKRGTPSLAEMRRWLVTPENTGTLVPRIRRLLEKAAARTLKTGKLPPGMAVFFRQTVLATAWQESCYRQFVVKKRKLTYLQSYNRTSVGLMQINERVWRGIYDLHQLRWNIYYNARAGCDIIDLYLGRYVFKKYGRALKQKKVSQDFLSALLYALYNGGPAELKKFPGRYRSGKLHRSDKLYREKLDWVKRGAWHHIRRCLGG